MMREKKPVKIFVCYSHKDEALKERLITFLFPLKQRGLIAYWEASQLLLGDNFTKEVLKQINQVDIFLYLISPDSISSKYINEIELKLAFELETANKAKIVPVILRPCNWKLLKINKLHAAPIGGKPVTLWPNIDQAFQTITAQIEKLVSAIISTRKEEATTIQKSKTKPKKNKSTNGHKSIFNGPIKAKYVFGEVTNLKINNSKKKK